MTQQRVRPDWTYFCHARVEQTTPIPTWLSLISMMARRRSASWTTKA